MTIVLVALTLMTFALVGLIIDLSTFALMKLTVMVRTRMTFALMGLTLMTSSYGISSNGFTSNCFNLNSIKLSSNGFRTDLSLHSLFYPCMRTNSSLR